MSGRTAHGDGWIGDRGSGSVRALSPGDSEAESAPLLLKRRNGLDDKRRWRSIRVMYVTMFIGSIGFSIILSSVWPYLQAVDLCVSAAFLGYVVAAYSIGQLIASPIFGWWANRQKTSLMPIIVSLVINFLGCMMYGFSGALPGDDQTNGVFMLVSRFIIGIGAGSVSVVRAYVSAATTMEERTAAMANISAGQSLGFIIGPGLAAAFRPIGATGVTWHALRLQVNMYTLPSFLGAVLALINMAVLLKWFTECTIAYEGSIQTPAIRNIQDEPERSLSDAATSINSAVAADDDDADARLCSCCTSDTHIKPVSARKSNGVDYVAALICIFLFFAVLFIFSVFETILSPLSMDEFGWDGEEATLYNGILLLSSGTVAVATFMIVKVLAKRYDERNIFVGGMVICAMAFVLYIPFSPGQPPLNYFNGTVTSRGLLGGSMAMENTLDSSKEFLSPSRSIAWTGVRASDMLPFYGSKSTPLRYKSPTSPYVNVNGNDDSDAFDASSNVGAGASAKTCQNGNATNGTAEGGCPVPTYAWCMDNHHLSFLQFLGGSLLMAVGYPTCAIMGYTIFSKILGPFPQGTMMGWLTAAGSAARAFGPMIVSNVYSAAGPRVAFASMSGFVLLSLGVLLVSYRRLVPYKAGLRR